jgi:hypothetical protein
VNVIGHELDPLVVATFIQQLRLHGNKLFDLPLQQQPL